MATPGLVFRIGGALDPSFKGALGESVAAARSAAATANRGGAMMARDLKGEIAALKKSLISDNFADSVLVNAPILAAIKSKEEQITHIANQASLRRIGIAKVEAAEVVAITRAQQLAMLQSVAVGGTSNAFGHGGGAGGGISGVVRESLVILREIGRGNLTRVPGSLLLLLQYTGMLTLLMKGEKTEALLAAAAQEKLAQSTARAAMAAQAKLRAAKIAAGIDVSSPELKAAEAEMATAAATAEGARAEATQLAAAGEAASADATAANLLALEAEADLAIKSGVAETLRARETAAAATVIKASAVTTAAAMALMILPIVLLVAILVEAYMIYKELAMIINRKSEAEKEAAEYTREHTIALWEEVEAMEKLKDASLKTTEALNKMNQAKDRSIELAHEAIEAANAEADAREKLYDAATKGKLLDVEIAEKKGLITHQQAAQQKAAIESQAVADKASSAQAKLDNAAKIASDAAQQADKDKADAQAKAQAASDKINKSPEGLKRAQMLAAAEKDLAASKTEADAKAKELNDSKTSGFFSARFSGFKNKADREAALKEEADAAANAAASAEIRVNALKRFMSPDEEAAAEALRIAGQKTSDADTLHDEANKAGRTAATNAKNSPAEVAAEQANIAKQEQLDEVAEKRGGKSDILGLTDRQRAGAQISGPAVALLDVNKQQLAVLHRIDKNTSGKTGRGNPYGD